VGDDEGVVIVWGVTLWVLWSCWLLAQYMKGPLAITRVSGALLIAELAMLAIHSFGCGDRGCDVAGSVAGDAASIDIPALALVCLTVAVAREWRRARRALS
jgi:hypothetical protein